MTGLKLGLLVLSTLKYLVEIDLAFRGCVQRPSGLLRQLLVRFEGHSGIDLDPGVILCEHCSQIYAV